MVFFLADFGSFLHISVMGSILVFLVTCYAMVCPSVQGDDKRALVSIFFPKQADRP